MNKVVNKFLLQGDKIGMPEAHLKQPGFTYSACGSFTRNKQKIQKFKETGGLRYIYSNELGKACFQYDMAYGDYTDLERRTGADKVLKDKSFKIASNSKYNGYERELVSMVQQFQIFQQKIKRDWYFQSTTG